MNKKTKMTDEVKRALDAAEPGDRKVMIAGLVCTGLMLVLALMWTFNIWEGAIVILAPLACVQMLIQVRLRWKNERKSAILHLLMAFFFLAC